jgi:nitrogen fixation/metabolism regulation signal transduction histidine kinase
MIYKRFNFLVVLRLLLLLVTVIIFSIIVGDTRLFFNQIILGLIFCIQVFDLIRFINQTNRELARFFQAIKHSDFSVTFTQSHLGNSFKGLQQSMAEIIEAYREVKIEKEAQFHFLQMLVNQLKIGIIALDGETITMINPTAELMLDIKGLKNWKLLHQRNPSLITEIEQLGDNGRKLIEMKTDFENRFISVDVSSLRMLNRSQKLITFQDINSEIEQKEIEAWHKLIRILTHEIMNSVTPISSLTETMQSLLQDKSDQQKPLQNITADTIDDLRFSLNTIQKRSDGLLHFIENYRKLTRVPKPTLEVIDVKTFLGSIEKLMTNELNRKNIILGVRSDTSLQIKADPTLVEQVLINLITNSIHAVEQIKMPTIELVAYEKNNQVIIEVRDNGKGIPPKELNEIFIPFFSTRKDGSGIGLSLSKQIMNMHGGTIKVKSDVNIGTVVSLTFKKLKA